MEQKKKAFEPTGTGHPHVFGRESQLFDTSTSVRMPPIGRFFMDEHSVIPCVCHDNRDYVRGALEFLRDRGKLIQDHTNIPPDTALASGVIEGMEFWEEDEDAYGALFSYNGSVIEIERKFSRRADQKAAETFSMSFYHKPGEAAPLKDFEPYLFPVPLTDIIYTIMRDSNGNVTFEPFEVNTPEGFDISLDYNEGFKDTSATIVNSLNQRKSGLYLFHGPPGTGKSTYIKYLASQVERELIYVPATFIDYLSDPAFMPALLNKRNSVLIIEDAEKALLARDEGDASSSLVSVLLNLTDGIMGDVFNIAIIATYNSDRRVLDKALLRKGRLKYEYKFNKLTVPVVNKLSDTKNLGIITKDPMSLAEVYNYNTDNTDDPDFEELLKEKKFGF